MDDTKFIKESLQNEKEEEKNKPIPLSKFTISPEVVEYVDKSKTYMEAVRKISIGSY